MGTQQILLIVLSVVIVGIAIAVGITMFNTQAKNSARQAIISDMTNFAASTMAYYRTPASQGGSGYGSTNWDADHIAEYVGIGYNSGGSGGYYLETDNAKYNISSVTSSQVIFQSIPNEGQLDVSGSRPQLTLTLSDGSQSIGTW